MKIIKIPIFFLILITFLNSCNTMSDAGKAIRNEKINTTDEFLVKKRQPLSLPPDYDLLPKPKSKNIIKNNSEDINEILKIPKGEVKKKGSSSVEQSIINQIRK